MKFFRAIAMRLGLPRKSPIVPVPEGLINDLGTMHAMVFTPMALLIRPEVTKELKLTEFQTNAIRQLQKERSKGSANKKKKSPKESKADDETNIMQIFREMREDEAGYAERALLLMDTSQRKRIKEIRIQVLGARAAFDPDIQMMLAVTEPQKVRLSALLHEYTEVKLFRVDTEMDPEQKKQLREELNAEFTAETAGVFTAAQNATLTEMQGAFFEDAAKLR